jgi:hypothetical protein
MAFRLPPKAYPGYYACRSMRRYGEAATYSDAHHVARWLLGLAKRAPVACHGCGIKDTELGGLISQMHAALNWQDAPVERLRSDYKGRIFSIRPDLDYVALCTSCHRRRDSWKYALPPGIRGSAISQIRQIKETS